MGSKLDQTHSDLARISSALLEGKKSKADKIREKARKRAAAQARKAAAKGGTRKQEKQQRTQDKLYKGQEPVRSKSGRQVPIGEPYQAPQDRPATPSPEPTPAPIQVRTPRPEPVGRPSQAVPPPVAAKDKLPKKPAKAPEPPKVTRPTPKPRVVTEPSGAPQKKPSLWRRVLGKKPAASPAKPKKPSLPRRAIGAFRRIAGMFKRKLLGEDQMMCRTLQAMALAEERSSTTFKKCSPGAMIATPHLRHSLPQNVFANPDEDNPTFPIRAGCRASKGGVLRALQKDMSGAGEALTKQVLQRINAQGGTRGKDRLKGWGTGVGGKRMETFRGPPGKAKRTGTLAKRLGISKKKAAALHGISKGKPDMVKHTPPYSPVGGSKGPAGNREVNRAADAHAKPKHKRSKRKEKRKASSRAVTVGRGKALAGR